MSEPLYILSKSDVAALKQLLHKVNTLRGENVVNTPNGISFATPSAPARSSALTLRSASATTITNTTIVVVTEDGTPVRSEYPYESLPPLGMLWVQRWVTIPADLDGTTPKYLTLDSGHDWRGRSMKATLFIHEGSVEDAQDDTWMPTSLTTWTAAYVPPTYASEFVVVSSGEGFGYAKLVVRDGGKLQLKVDSAPRSYDYQVVVAVMAYPRITAPSAAPPPIVWE